MGALSTIRSSAARAHSARPFVTDCTGGMRTELSGTVFEQWVAKTANWLDGEFGSGVLIHVDLRPHWLWPVLVAALDEIEGALAPEDRADALFCHGLREDASLPVISVHDHPMAMPFPSALPLHHFDFFRDVRGGADVRSAGPKHREPLLLTGFSTFTAEELLALVPGMPPEQRVAMHVTSMPVEAAGQIAALTLLPWATGSSLVLSDGTTGIAGERTTCELTLTAV